MIRRSLLCLGCVVLTFATLRAAPLSRQTDIDFYRDVPSRSLKGLAARSDGRLVAGPTFTDLSGEAPADLFWCLSATEEPSRWLAGSGPDGKIFEITLDAKRPAFTARELVKLDEPHIFAIATLEDGALLVGTSPRGALCLVRDGKLVARVGLPVDSIFDLLLLPPDGSVKKPRGATRALVATGNPGRIYQIDLAKFAASTVTADKTADTKQLAERGITLFAEIRDRNVRRLARLSDGRIVAGSAPRGNIYAFSPQTGAVPSAPAAATTEQVGSHLASILQENRDAEVTDLLPTAEGGLFASLTFSAGSGESRITPPRGGKDQPDVISLMPPSADRFGGRSSLVWIPANGFPEVVASRVGAAFYRLAQRGEVVIVAGGEQGDMLGYDIRQRLSLTFAGSVSSQLNGLAPIAGQPDRFLVLRNNAPGFAILDFGGRSQREAETRRIDLGSPALLGALRFNRLREVAARQLGLDLKTSNGSDEVEGWSGWTPLAEDDGGWSAADLRGRYVRLRLSLPAETTSGAQLDKAALYFLPQNRRPQLQDFRLLSANFSLIPSLEPSMPPVMSLGQIMQGGGKDEESKSKGSFLGSQVVPAPGMQVVLWTVNDPDGDNIVFTFSLRRDGDPAWTDIAVGSPDSYVQFDTSHLRDGVYFTRLTATETAPRLDADRLTTFFETDDLVVDHGAPEILQAAAERRADRLVLTVHGRDGLSLMDGVEAILNNGTREQTEQPQDGIRDSREETFVLEIPLARVSGASAVELTLYDAVGNTVSRRLPLDR